MQKTPEDILISQAISGNEDAWREIYRRYHAGVCRVVSWRKWGLKRAEVEEVVQEVFMELARSLPKFRQEASLSTFLTRLSKNKCISLLRHKGAQKRVKEEYGFVFEEKRGDFEAGHQMVIKSSTDDPMEKILFEEEAVQIMKALKELTSECRSIIRKRYFEDLSYNEISDQMKLPLGTVCSRLKRCLLKLKEIYQKKIRKV